VLALAPPAWAATLGGRVTDPQGRPVAGAQVVVSTSFVTTAIALTDAAGAFELEFFSAGYSVLNAGLSIPVRSGVEVYARGLNLADRSYEETLGYPALGRSAMVGVRVAAGR
jgi:outer membrane receptor protein involved in Fe transport